MQQPAVIASYQPVNEAENNPSKLDIVNIPVKWINVSEKEINPLFLQYRISAKALMHWNPLERRTVFWANDLFKAGERFHRPSIQATAFIQLW